MAKLNIKNIENVEGDYHLMFFEGKKIIDTAKSDMRYALLSLLFYLCFVAIFVIVSGFNIYYIGFLLIFLVFFVAICVYLAIQKHIGVKQCVKAVQNSRASDIVARQVDNRSAGRAIVKSMSNSLDKYDENERFPTILKKYRRKRKHDHIVGAIERFEREEKNSATK